MKDPYADRFEDAVASFAVQLRAARLDLLKELHYTSRAIQMRVDFGGLPSGWFFRMYDFPRGAIRALPGQVHVHRSYPSDACIVQSSTLWTVGTNWRGLVDDSFPQPAEWRARFMRQARITTAANLTELHEPGSHAWSVARRTLHLLNFLAAAPATLLQAISADGIRTAVQMPGPWAASVDRSLRQHGLDPRTPAMLSNMLACWTHQQIVVAATRRVIAEK
jgi:hypothetical protein